jgi:hypothetical protein
MSLCSQLREYLDGEMGPLGRWRMQRHLRACPACSEQKAAEESLLPFLTSALAESGPEEAAAAERVTRRWAETFAAAPPVYREAPVQRARPGRRLMAAGAALGMAVALFVGTTLYLPRKALAEVRDAMAKVDTFHIRMQIPASDTRYEGWGQRKVGARVEEWEGNRRTMILIDDGKRLRRYYPQEKVVRESDSRLRTIFRQAAGFNASKMLSQAVRGKLFEGQEWLGEATAREVARIRRNGSYQRRVQVDLKDGFFDRMVIYADIATDRLTQANLYSGRDTPDDEPMARVFFDYPQTLPSTLFRLAAPPGAKVRYEESDLQLP